MKTTLARLKTMVDTANNAGGDLTYVKHVEIIHPEIGLTLVSKASLPAIFITPVGTVERWVASQEKEAVHTVALYCVMAYHQRESALMGDSTRPAGQGKGIVDFAADVMGVVRGHRLAVDGTHWLTRPIDLTNVTYIVEQLGEHGHVQVAELTLEGGRVFLQTTLPGNV